MNACIGAIMTDEQTTVELPKQHAFMSPILRYLSDGKTHTNREIYAGVAELVGLTPEQMNLRHPTSSIFIYSDRIYWALFTLKTVKATASLKEGQHVIGEYGRQLLREFPDGLPDDIIQSIARKARELTPRYRNSINPANKATAVEDSTPDELISSSMVQLETALAQNVLERIRNLSPSGFERLVVDVLLAMGYGGSEGRGMVTQASNDGGIDGVIDQDALGLTKIYVQAKRYGEKNSVGRPEVQSFVGAMHGQASQGVFITSGSFTSGAREYAQNLGGGLSLVLIDGERLARLMIKYRVGVQVARTYTVMKLDEDFFEES